MGQMFAFHKSVRGQGHINKGLLCEDSSVSYNAEDGKYYIAIVADGHGQEKSFRSKDGSQIVVDVALECLQEFAKTALATEDSENRFYKDILTNPRYRQMTIRQLTNTILASWSDRILNDYTSNPPNEDELGGYAEYYENKDNVPQIYGTTLIAALRLPKCLILLHQGDGRCDVFYEDGTVAQPIPWDPRCEGNQTTSLCDEDASESFRHCIIDIEKNPVIACYVGSDGVEDAYRTQEGTHTFYRDLTCILTEKKPEDFDSYLEEMLPEFSAYGRFSKTGSQDDVSVAGIVDLEAVQPLIPLFRIEVQKYAIGEDLFWKEDELRSKMRKHDILQRRMKEAQDKVVQENNTLERLKAELGHLLPKKSILQDQILQLQQEIDADKAEYSAFADYFQSDTEPEDEEKREIVRFLKRKVPHVIQSAFTELTNGFSSQEMQQNRLVKEFDDLSLRISDTESAIENTEKTMLSLQDQAAQAKITFEEFDAKFQKIASQIDSLKTQIAEVSMPSP